MELNDISGAIVNSAMLVHSELGPGLLEEPYKQCLAYELISRGFKVDIEPELPIIYRGIRINIGYRLDLTAHLKDGIVRMVNNLPPASSPSPVVQMELRRT
jgi:GxxExxY protein